jgi:hypothetical protein
VTHGGKVMKLHKFVLVSQREAKCEEHPDQVLELTTDDYMVFLLHTHTHIMACRYLYASYCVQFFSRSKWWRFSLEHS